MSQGIKKINVDENNNGFAFSSKVVGDGSLFIKSGDDYILQEDLRNGVGILAVDLATTNSSRFFFTFLHFSTYFCNLGDSWRQFGQLTSFVGPLILTLYHFS